MSRTLTLAAAALCALPLTAGAFSQSTNTGSFSANTNGQAAGFAAPVSVGVAGNSLAQIAGRLTTETGRALYSFASDPVGGSVCTGTCAGQWPPYLVGPVPVNIPGFTAVVRPDGRRQWALNGKPLYLYVGDAAVGQFNGDGIPGWQSIALQTN